MSSTTTPVRGRLPRTLLRKERRSRIIEDGKEPNTVVVRVETEVERTGRRDTETYRRGRDREYFCSKDLSGISSY